MGADRIGQLAEPARNASEMRCEGERISAPIIFRPSPLRIAGCEPSPPGFEEVDLYGSSAERTAALPGWLFHYNFTRRHGSLVHGAPGTRLAELNNVIGNYS